MTKFERVTRINEIVARLGRVTPQLVVEKIAVNLSGDVNTENLRRSVYYDLKELAIAGRLAVEYCNLQHRFECLVCDLWLRDGNANSRNQFRNCHSRSVLFDLAR